MFRREGEQREDGGQTPAAEARQAPAPPPPQAAPRPAEGAIAPAAMPIGWANWDGALAGSVVGLGAIILLSMIVQAFGWVDPDVGINAFGDVDFSTAFWATVVFGAGLLIGGYVAGFVATVHGTVSSAFAGLVVWGVAVIGSVIAAAADAGPLFGMVGEVFNDISRAVGTQTGIGALDAEPAWWTVVALGGGLALAVLGAAVGGLTPRAETYRPRR